MRKEEVVTSFDIISQHFLEGQRKIINTQPGHSVSGAKILAERKAAVIPSQDRFFMHLQRCITEEIILIS
jgi:hypothetical protein